MLQITEAARACLWLARFQGNLSNYRLPAADNDSLVLLGAPSLGRRSPQPVSTRAKGADVVGSWEAAAVLVRTRSRHSRTPGIKD